MPSVQPSQVLRPYALPSSPASERANPECLSGIREAFVARALLSHLLAEGDPILQQLRIDPIDCALLPGVHSKLQNHEVGSIPFFQILDLKIGPGVYRFNGGEFRLQDGDFGVTYRSGNDYPPIAMDEDVVVAQYRHSGPHFGAIVQIARLKVEENRY